MVSDCKFMNDASNFIVEKCMNLDKFLHKWFDFLFQEMKDLKADNQRLKDENGALIRVISKLSK